MTRAAAQKVRRTRRVLARELVQDRTRRRPGETVALTDDQIAWLEPQGYFTPEQEADNGNREKT